MLRAENATLRQIGPPDLGEVARVHILAFPDSVLSKLGPAVVRAYYDWQLIGPNDVYATGIYDGDAGQLLGFCFGGVFRDSVNGFIRRHWALIASRLALRPWLIGDPLFRDRFRLGLRVLRRARRKARPEGAASEGGVENAAERHGILSLAVDPQTHKQGLGKRLMLDQEAYAWRRGRQTMRLSVARDNEGAIAFYERLGYRKYWTERDRRWKGQMRKALTPEGT